MTTRSPTLALLVAVGAVLTQGCAGTSSPSPAPGAAPGSGISDAEIAHVVVTANAIDVEMAGLAQGRAQSAEVLRFSRTMTSDHQAVNARAQALVNRLGVEPRDNEVSRSLRADAAPVLERLRGLMGLDFDRAYLAREVAYHENVLDAMDGVLIPGASNADLRALLVEVRPAFEAHLEQARSARATLR